MDRPLEDLFDRPLEELFSDYAKEPKKESEKEPMDEYAKRYDERGDMFAGSGYRGEPIPYFEMLESEEERGYFSAMDNKQRLYYINYVVDDLALAHQLLMHYHDQQIQQKSLARLEEIISMLFSRL